MSLTAEFQLRSPRLPLIDVAAAMPNLTFQLENTDQSQSRRLVFFIQVAGPSFDGVDTALADSSLVREQSLISEVGSIRKYQVVLDGPRPAFLDEILSHETFTESITIMSDGWYLRQQFSDKDEFTTYRELWQSMDFSIRVDRLYDSTTTDVELIGLSDKQHEALLTAYKMGYFTIPQETSLDDIADELDISRSALAERLSRAEAHLIEHFFYTDLY